MMLIQYIFFFCSGLTQTLPYGFFFFVMFMLIISPLQYFIEGILHQEYAYGIQHRIFGQYKFNRLAGITNYFCALNQLPAMVQAFLDALILIVLFCGELFQLKNESIASDSGKILGLDA